MEKLIMKDNSNFEAKLLDGLRKSETLRKRYSMYSDRELADMQEKLICNSELKEGQDLPSEVLEVVDEIEQELDNREVRDLELAECGYED
jgi:hypothetical protein